MKKRIVSIALVLLLMASFGAIVYADIEGPPVFDPIPPRPRHVVVEVELT
jgi:hypothetical protein